MLRAAKNLLVITEGRKNAASHIKDMGETVKRLTAARDQHQEQAKLAQEHGAGTRNAGYSG